MAEFPKRSKTLGTSNTTINDLPDSLLGQILSHLPAKDAVVTSVLSKQWINLFTLPDKFTIEDRILSSYPELTNSFNKFVHKVLIKRTSSLDTLILGFHDHTRLMPLVYAAVRLNVKFLQLAFRMAPDYLLIGLNGCNSLLSLELQARCALCDLPDGFTLPRLESLTLLGFDLDAHNISKFMEAFPVLETLSMHYCCFTNLKTTIIYIRSHFLKKFSMLKCKGRICLKPDLPNLKVLSFLATVISIYKLFPISSLLTRLTLVTVKPQIAWMQLHLLLPALAPFNSTLVVRQLRTEAYILTEFGAYVEVEVDNLLVLQIPCLCLELSRLEPQVEFLVAAAAHLRTRHFPINMDLHRVSVDVPMFQNLTWLKLGDLHHESGWEILLQFLTNAPNLEKLVFEKGYTKHKRYFEDSEFEGSFLTLIGLELHLKEIDFLEFNGDKGEFELIEYFLKNGKDLRKLKLHCVPIDDSCIHDRLHKLSKKPNVFITFACWKDEELVKRRSSQSLSESWESKLSMSELVESKRKLSMMNPDDLSTSNSNFFESKEHMIMMNQKMIEMMNALMQHGIMPAQPPSQPLPAND